MSGPKITLRIDEITASTAGLDRASLETALRAELSAAIAAHGVGAIGTGSTRPLVEARLTQGTRPGAAEVAQAVVRSVVK